MTLRKKHYPADLYPSFIETGKMADMKWSGESELRFAQAQTAIIDALTKFDRPGEAERKILEIICKLVDAATGHLLNVGSSALKEWKFQDVRYCKFTRKRFAALEADFNRHIGSFPLDPVKMFETPGIFFRHAEIGKERWYDSDYYRFFMKKNGLDESAAILCKDAEGKAAFGIGMSFECGVRISAESRALLEELAPLIGRGLTNLQRWYWQYSRKHAADLISEHSEDAIAIVELIPRGPQVLALSGGARKLLAARENNLDRNCLDDFLNVCRKASRPDGTPAVWTSLDGQSFHLDASTAPPLSISPTLVVRFASGGNKKYSNFSTAVARYRGLSEREAELMALVAAGKADKEIARHLHLSIHTIRAHLRNIYKKLNVSGRVTAIQAIYGESN